MSSNKEIIEMWDRVGEEICKVIFTEFINASKKVGLENGALPIFCELIKNINSQLSSVEVDNFKIPEGAINVESKFLQ